MKTYFIYILASYRHGTLYVGVTSNLLHRMFQHRHGLIDGFSKTYRTHVLVYFEETNDVRSAIHREKCIKRWKRSWKIELIESMNPTWSDLSRTDAPEGFLLSQERQRDVARKTGYEASPV